MLRTLLPVAILAGSLATAGAPTPDSPPAPPDDGLVTVESAVSFDETYARLRSAIEANENLRILAEVDHGANARGVDRSLPPTRLLLFGNPNLGTPLMRASRTTAIDLPQKMLVWTSEDGRVFVTYNAPSYLAWRHGLEDGGPLETVAGALESLAAGATR